MGNLPIFRIIMASVVTLGIFALAKFPGWLSIAIVLSVLIVVSVSYLHSFFPGRLSIYAKLALAAFIVLTVWGMSDSDSKRVLSEAFKSRGITTNFWWADKVRSDYDNNGGLSLFDARKKIIGRMSEKLQVEVGVIAYKVDHGTMTEEDGLTALDALVSKQNQINKALGKTRLIQEKGGGIANKVKNFFSSSTSTPPPTTSARSYGGRIDFGGSAIEGDNVVISRADKFEFQWEKVTPLKIRFEGGYYNFKIAVKTGEIEVETSNGNRFRVSDRPGTLPPIPGNVTWLKVQSTKEVKSEFVLTTSRA